MSLSAREQKILEQIGRDLAGSDPELASFSFGFTWLAAGEALPDREQGSAGCRGSSGHAAVRGNSPRKGCVPPPAGLSDPRIGSWRGRCCGS
jgi:hypothetical protein